MQVKIGKLKLAGTFTESVSDYHYTRSSDIQVGRVFRSTPRLFDRGNHISRMTFTVNREHSTPADAVGFVHDHPEDIPSDGGILEVSITDSGKTIRRFFRKAVVEVVEARFVGATTIHTYNITGVSPSKTAT